MTTKTVGTLVLVLAPAALCHLAGFREAAHYIALGSMLALQLGVLAGAAFVPALLLSTLGHWFFWTLRSGRDRVAA